MGLVPPIYADGVMIGAISSVPTDGVTDATAALQAVAALGGPISLKAGATYLLSGGLTLSAGQTLRGNGATLKRAAQFSTTTTTAITANVTNTITVADASGFSVGQTISVINGTSYDQSNRIIQSIVGNVITTTTAFNLSGGAGAGSVSGTTTVFVSFHVLTMGSDSRLFDLKIDGNRSNWTNYRWEITKGIVTNGDRCLISGCYLNNSPGEGIYLTGGDYHRVRDCWVTNANGNGVHLSGTTHPLVSGCRVDTVNLDTNTGHADGCIIWSNSIVDGTISNCYMANGIAGVGSIDSSDNSDVTITGNTIRSCTYAFEGICPQTNPARVLFEGNRVYSCGLSGNTGFQWGNTNGTPTVWPNQLIARGNLFYQTHVSLLACQDTLFEGNIFDLTGSTTAIALLIDNCQGITVRGNKFLGGGYAVYIQTAGTRDILVEGNQCSLQQTTALREQTASLTNVRIQANTVYNDDTAASGFDGILARDGCHIFGNSVQITKGHAGIYPQNGAIVEHNVVRITTATYSIRADGGTTTVICKDNSCTSAPSNGGTNTFTNNATIA